MTKLDGLVFNFTKKELAMNKYHLILISMLLFNGMLMADETTVTEAEDVPEIVPVSLGPGQQSRSYCSGTSKGHRLCLRPFLSEWG